MTAPAATFFFFFFLSTKYGNLSRIDPGADVVMIGSLVFPGEYVAFDHFLCHTKEEDVDSRGGSISQLSLPLHELRQYKNELCLQLFGRPGGNGLDTRQRIRLAKALRHKYNSSPKQIARVCGLVFREVKDLL